jgi:hypothetical protein
VFALFGSLLGLIHPAVGFPAQVKGCYVTPLEQVQTCLCAHCNLRVERILTLTHCSASHSECGATIEWTQDNTLSFTELYEKMSLMWDPNHPKYNNLHKHGAWEEIAKAVWMVPEECKKRKKRQSYSYKRLFKNTK